MKSPTHRASARRTLLVSCSACLALAAPLVLADDTLSASKMWQLQRLGEPTLAPDGQLAVVPVTRFDVDANKGLTDLWIVPTDGSPARQLTSDAASDTSPTFAPDGKHIAFVSKRGDDKENQIYVIPTDGGEARRVTNLPTGADTPKWFSDSKRIAFVSRIWNDLAMWADQGKRKKERDDSKMSGRLWERAPIAYWDRYLDDREPHIFIATLAAAGAEPAEPQAVTRQSGFSLPRSEYSRSSYDIAPDGTEVVFEANVDRTGSASNFDIIALASCGCKPPRNLTEANKAQDSEPNYSPDGRYLVYTAQRIIGFYADRKQLTLLERSSDTKRELATNWDRSAENLRWLPDSRGLIGSIDDAATNRLYRFDLSTAAPRAITRSSSFSGLALASRAKAPAARAVALRQSFSEPPTLVALDLGSGAARKLSAFNDLMLGAIKLGKVESVSYTGARNQPIQMWVVYPPNFDANKKYPAYMLLHGGPHNGITDATQWRWNAHVFAAWGYVVTWHNFHGSSGFGQNFTDSINPDRISLPYEDTIRAADWLRAQAFIDGERMVAGGGSYGGFLASTLLGRKHPFKALVAHAAVYNNFTQIAADYAGERDRFFEFWERPEEFARYSPHTSAANFNTPTLVIHGQQDLRVPVNHGVELFNTLQKRGVASKLLYFPDENHWILKPQNSLYWYQTVKEWLAQYAAPGAH